MSEKACSACGAWWLPGAERCPEHRPLRDDYDNSRVQRDAPRVYPQPDPFLHGILIPRWWDVRDR